MPRIKHLSSYQTRYKPAAKGAGPNGLSYAAPGSQLAIQRETDDELGTDQHKENESSTELIDESKGLTLPKMKHPVKINDEQHTIFANDLGDGPELMMASTPVPLEEYIKKNLSESEQRKALLDFASSIRRQIADASRITNSNGSESGRWMRDTLPGLQQQQQHTYNDINQNIMILARTVQTAIEEKWNLPKGAADRPNSTKPIHLGWQNLGTHPSPGGLLPFTGTKGIIVDYLTVNGEAGSPTTQQPSGNPGNLRTVLGKTNYGQRYTMGHLLNRELHGSGQDWENLAVITAQFNDDTENEPGPEHVAKQKVLGENEVIRYVVEVRYDRAAGATHYEDLLPTSWEYTFSSYERNADIIDGTSYRAWQFDKRIELQHSIYYQRVKRKTLIIPANKQPRPTKWDIYEKALPGGAEFPTDMAPFAAGINKSDYIPEATPALSDLLRDLVAVIRLSIKEIEMKLLAWATFSANIKDEYPHGEHSQLFDRKDLLTFPAKFLKNLEVAEDAFFNRSMVELFDIKLLRSQFDALCKTHLKPGEDIQLIHKMLETLQEYLNKDWSYESRLNLMNESSEDQFHGQLDWAGHETEVGWEHEDSMDEFDVHMKDEMVF